MKNARKTLASFGMLLISLVIIAVGITGLIFEAIKAFSETVATGLMSTVDLFESAGKHLKKYSFFNSKK